MTRIKRAMKRNRYLFIDIYFSRFFVEVEFRTHAYVRLLNEITRVNVS